MLRQNEIRLRSAQRMVWGPIPRQGDVALARDVLDHQLVDLAGVQVVRAADVYLLNGPGGWELAGIDVGLQSLAQRLLPKTKVCPPPDRVIDWAQLHAFVARFTDTTLGLDVRADDRRGHGRQWSTACGFGRPAERTARRGCDGTSRRSQPRPTGPAGRVRATLLRRPKR